jgi:hypothetical protein
VTSRGLRNDRSWQSCEYIMTIHRSHENQPALRQPRDTLNDSQTIPLKWSRLISPRADTMCSKAAVMERLAAWDAPSAPDPYVGRIVDL